MNEMKHASPAMKLTLATLLLAACGGAQPAAPATVVPPTIRPTALPPTAVPPSPIPLTAIPPEAMAGLNPSPRAYVSMAYDIKSNRVILFGGHIGDYSDPRNSSGETWAYDAAANTWTEMKPASGPTRRAANGLAYDAESDRVILFGGEGPDDVLPLADTWAYDYDTNAWKQMATGPSLHLGARLAYDAESDRIIMFGGYNLGGELQNDTWAYDYNSDTWTEMKPGIRPPGRNYQGMAYDAESDRVLTWGGIGPDNSLLPPSVWAYDFNKNTWQEMKAVGEPHPQGADYAAMAYDAKADRTILFGGFPQGDETWAYDYNTNTWTRLYPGTVPGKLSRHALAYSAATDRVIQFGGQIGSQRYNYSGETWTYDLKTNTWTNVTPHR